MVSNWDCLCGNGTRLEREDMNSPRNVKLAYNVQNFKGDSNTGTVDLKYICDFY